MPKKSKTIKSFSKRFKITKSDKVKKIKQGQNHFNAKATGKATRNKRQDLTLSNSDAKVIKSLIK